MNVMSKASLLLVPIDLTQVAMQPFALCLGNQHLSTLIQLVRQLAPIAIVPQEKALNDVPSIERRTEE